MMQRMRNSTLCVINASKSRLWMSVKIPRIMNVTAKKSGSRADNIMVPLKVSTNMPKIISVKHTRSPQITRSSLGICI